MIPLPFRAAVDHQEIGNWRKSIVAETGAEGEVGLGEWLCEESRKLPVGEMNIKVFDFLPSNPLGGKWRRGKVLQFMEQRRSRVLQRFHLVHYEEDVTGLPTTESQWLCLAAERVEPRKCMQRGGHQIVAACTLPADCLCLCFQSLVKERRTWQSHTSRHLFVLLRHVGAFAFLLPFGAGDPDSPRSHLAPRVLFSGGPVTPTAIDTPSAIHPPTRFRITSGAAIPSSAPTSTPGHDVQLGGYAYDDDPTALRLREAKERMEVR